MLKHRASGNPTPGGPGAHHHIRKLLLFFTRTGAPSSHQLGLGCRGSTREHPGEECGGLTSLGRGSTVGVWGTPLAITGCQALWGTLPFWCFVWEAGGRGGLGVFVCGRRPGGCSTLSRGPSPLSPDTRALEGHSQDCKWRTHEEQFTTEKYPTSQDCFQRWAPLLRGS